MTPLAAQSHAVAFQDSESGLVTVPLKKFCCDIEDYTAVLRPEAEWEKVLDHRRQLKVSKLYENATQMLAWIAGIMFVVALAARVLHVATSSLTPSSLIPVAGVGHFPRSFRKATPQTRALAHTAHLAPPALCEDADPGECANLLTQTPLNSSERAATPTKNGGPIPALPPQCSPHSGGRAAARCPASCGLCAVVLADCHEVLIEENACKESEDVVGMVCQADGDMKKEGYCTWLPTSGTGGTITKMELQNRAAAEHPRRFVCAHCKDKEMSFARRALMAQMLELRMEEDHRKRDALDERDANVRERDALTVAR